MKLGFVLLLMVNFTMKQTQATFLGHKIIIENLALKVSTPQPSRTDYKVSLENFKATYTVHWFTRAKADDCLDFIKTAQRFTYIEGDRPRANTAFESRQLFAQIETDSAKSELIFICQFQLLVKSGKQNTFALPKIDKK